MYQQQEKLDVLDLLIAVLQGHEEKLDRMFGELTLAVENLLTLMNRMEEKCFSFIVVKKK